MFWKNKRIDRGLTMSKIKKLIEVALPLDAINAASAREKSIRHGHPSTLHLWWARRPLATARAVIFASLVDAPSSHPELFPTKQEQDRERKRLFGIIERLVQWKNINDKELFDEAYAEIKRYCGDEMPTLLDPFAGGGAIPLEAQRLGLKAIAADLNPVAVMINKAMIEIPPKFADMPPVNPKDRSAMLGAESDWHGARGLAADVRYYGELLKQKAFEKIGHLYPKVKNPETGEDATVIAWIWARTVKCPNPACGCEMPLVKSFWLSKKNGNEAYIEPIVKDGQIEYSVCHGHDHDHVQDGTIVNRKAKCVACGETVPLSYIQEEGKQKRVNHKLMAIVLEGEHGRVYADANESFLEKISPDDIDIPNMELAYAPRYMVPELYGMEHYEDLFTPRQLKMLKTLVEILPEVKENVIADIKRNNSNHVQAEEYSKAIMVYLAFLVDKLADYNSAVCSWNSSGEKMRNTFGRQAIPMVWDYAEANPFSHSSGCIDNMLEWIEKSVRHLPASRYGQVMQKNASQDNGLRNIVVSTDPPYYDNIGYADLADFFYLWLRQSLGRFYPEIFGTMQVPKKEELIASPYRFDSKKGMTNKQQAKAFFEDGMKSVCINLHKYARDDVPVTIYYAFKQNDMDEQVVASSGWETMLNAIIDAGFAITGTWPVRTEMGARLRSFESNALASSIVLVCRKREQTGQVCSRKDFLRQLRSELVGAIEKLQSASIAPVDMMQSAIGPGISVFSRYDHVIEADGSKMSVRTALQIINQELDAFFGGQSEGLDAESRFAVELFAQSGFDELDFGTADVLARAKNTSVAKVADTGAIISGRGKVRLTKREEMESKKAGDNSSWVNLQRLAFAMEREGIRGCANLLKDSYGSNDVLKNLAYHMYQLAEEKHLSSEAGVYNNLVVSWNDILTAVEELRSQQPEQINLMEG